MLKVEQLASLEFTNVKFIRFEDDSWEFWEVDLWSPNHKEVASGRSVKGAGTLAVKLAGNWRMEDSYSSSLSQERGHAIGCDEDTWQELEKILGCHIKSRLED